MENDHQEITYDYLFYLSDEEVDSAVHDLCTTFDTINKYGFSGSRTGQQKDVSECVYEFLLEIGFIDDCDHFITDDGKAYFETLFVHKDEATAADFMRKKLLMHPVVNLIGQVFYGRGQITVEQLKVLLNYHKVSEGEVDYSQTVSLLELLNGHKIIVYSRRNKSFRVAEPANIDSPITQYYIDPSTPFSNVYNMRRVLRASKGKVFWVDKHFRKEGFEIIIDGLSNDGVKAVTIISGPDNCTPSAKADYDALRTELRERGMELAWRIITDASFLCKWHDRWIVSDTTCYNIPPVLAIIRGQRSDIIRTENTLDVEPFVDASTPVEIT